MCDGLDWMDGYTQSYLRMGWMGWVILYTVTPRASLQSDANNSKSTTGWYDMSNEYKIKISSKEGVKKTISSGYYPPIAMSEQYDLRGGTQEGEEIWRRPLDESGNGFICGRSGGSLEIWNSLIWWQQEGDLNREGIGCTAPLCRQKTGICSCCICDWSSRWYYRGPMKTWICGREL